MLVKQISVFLENKSGRLAEVTKTLKEHLIDIRALYIADTTEYGILRMIVDQPEKAQAVLSAAGFHGQFNQRDRHRDSRSPGNAGSCPGDAEHGIHLG